jgi:hypothetical protein
MSSGGIVPLGMIAAQIFRNMECYNPADVVRLTIAAMRKRAGVCAHVCRALKSYDRSPISLTV